MLDEFKFLFLRDDGIYALGGKDGILVGEGAFEVLDEGEGWVRGLDGYGLEEFGGEELLFIVDFDG